jgi:hypothetical protein
MITNPIQRIRLFYGELLIRMKDKEVSLNSVINSANTLRVQRGLPVVDILDYTRSSNFVEMVMATEIKLGYRAFNDTTTNVTVEYKPNGDIKRYRLTSSPLVRAVRGRLGSTWVHPYIAIDAAAHLDKHLAVDLYEILTTSPIFQLREDGGDLYKELTDATLWLMSATGNTERAYGKLQLLARIIAARCGIAIRTDNATWNYATAEQLQVRRDLQFAVTVAIRNNMLVSFQHLIDYVGNGYFPVTGLQQINLNEVIKEKVTVLNFLENQPAVMSQPMQFVA